MALKAFLCYDGDGIGAKVGRAALSNDVAYLKEISAKIEAGNDLFRGWCLSVLGGDIIGIGGDEGRLSIPVDHIADVAKLKDKYFEITGFTCSIGIGVNISQANKALIVAKNTGKNKITLYSNRVEQQLEQMDEGEKNESKKLFDEYLKKSVFEEEQVAEPIGKQELLDILLQIKDNICHLKQSQYADPELINTLSMLAAKISEKFSDTAPAEPGKKELNKTKLNLPVGSRIDDKEKIQHGDGSVGWVHLAAGAIMSDDGHPVSSRKPDGK